MGKTAFALAIAVNAWREDYDMAGGTGFGDIGYEQQIDGRSDGPSPRSGRGAPLRRGRLQAARAAGGHRRISRPGAPGPHAPPGLGRLPRAPRDAAAHRGHDILVERRGRATADVRAGPLRGDVEGGGPVHRRGGGSKRHGVGPGTARRPGPRRRRGPPEDGGGRESPAGIFWIGPAFGYADDGEGKGIKMPYMPVTPSLECVDDEASTHYNRVVDREAVTTRDWKSSEKMLRKDALYRWGAVIGHNTKTPVPGAGSCMFLHPWSGPGIGTPGCTAAPEDRVFEILAWLDPAARPVIVQLPRAEYDRLAPAWGLPSL